MDPDTFAPTDVIHLFAMEIDLDPSVGDVVLQLLMMMRWGNANEQRPAKKQAQASLMQLWKK